MSAIEVPSQKPIDNRWNNSQAYKHAQTLSFYQCEITPTFIFFAFLSMWDNTYFHTPTRRQKFYDESNGATYKEN